MEKEIRKRLEKQGYRLIGKHSAIKTCLWCKESIRGKDSCYKNTFYGIQSWRCIQTSVSLFNCYNKCQFCWRDLSYTTPEMIKEPDNTDFIIDNCIKEHKLILMGFKGSEKINKKRFEEAMNPKHFALSLAGDATLYPKLPELIKEIHKRNMTSFLVTNGLNPSMLKKLLKQQPTQTYITLAAPNEDIYKETCNPLIEDYWSRLKKSLSLLKEFKRSTLRLTLAKNLNMLNPEQYAEIIEKTNPKFTELKAYMPVGYSQYRLKYKSMPYHKEIKDFANRITEKTNLEIIDENPKSRVVLLAKKDYKDRKFKF